MPNPITDRGEITIDCSQGNKVLKRVKNMVPKDEATTEFATFSSHEGRPGGYIDVPGGITLTITETPEIPEEINWDKLKKAKEYFTINVQYKGGAKLGKREQYVDCRVSDVSSPRVGDDGNAEREIIVKALDKKEL